MAETNQNGGETPKKKRKRMPLGNQERKMDYLTNLAIDLAEEKLLDKTASSQIITTLLEFGTAKKKLELKKLESEVALTKAKETQIKESTTTGEMIRDVIEAFKKYSGHKDMFEEDE